MKIGNVHKNGLVQNTWWFVWKIREYRIIMDVKIIIILMQKCDYFPHNCVRVVRSNIWRVKMDVLTLMCGVFLVIIWQDISQRKWTICECENISLQMEVIKYEAFILIVGFHVVFNVSQVKTGRSVYHLIEILLKLKLN